MADVGDGGRGGCASFALVRGVHDATRSSSYRSTTSSTALEDDVHERGIASSRAARTHGPPTSSAAKEGGFFATDASDLLV